VVPSASPSATSTVLTGRPLAGRTIALDPGHNRGNAGRSTVIAQRQDTGAGTAPCDTVGATSADGYEESAFALAAARALQRRLQALGAEVVLTRRADSGAGPCFPERAAIAEREDADVLVSLHAESLPAQESGFTVLRPGLLPCCTEDIAEASGRLGRAVRDALVGEGLTPSPARGEDGLLLRTDVGVLNRSDVPAVLVSAGNLNNARDVERLRSGAGQELVAAALAKGLVAYLG
jgi:N-acetylmuramoyl-L-alanine amidase